MIRGSTLLLAIAGCAPQVDPAAAVDILSQRCLSCHGPDGVWPPLHDADALAGLAPQAHAAVRSGSMPPWAPSAAGPALQGELALSDPERDILLDWLGVGAPVPEGSELRPPERPEFHADWVMPIPQHPVDGDQTRCFLVDLPSRALTGFDVQASAAVHHALLGIYPESERPRFAARDAADPGPGWSCPNAFMPAADPPPERVPVRWFPSPSPSETQPGTGIPLGSTGVLQIHGLGDGDASGELRLSLADEVIAETDLVLGGADIELPVDQAEVTRGFRGFVGSLLHPRRDEIDQVWIVAARGHGHSQLRRLTLAIDEAPVLDLVRWDPRIQPRYLLEQPLPVSTDAILSLTCTYDNRVEARREAELYGDEGEMCGGWIYVTTEPPP